MQRNKVIEVNHVSKRLGNRTIIDNLSLHVNEGEIVGFLGPNGSGKTTSIRMMTGMIKPDQGSIKIMGYDIQAEFSLAMKHIGAIVEQPALYGYLSGWENLMQAVRISGMQINKERIEWCVRMVQLQERMQEKVQRYSLGMKQRLAIAQALLTQPKMIILDEPTNGLDPSGIIEMRTLIHKLRDETGVSVFISSHLLSEIEQLCDRVIVIDQGKTLAAKEMSSLGHAAIALTVQDDQLQSAYHLLQLEGLHPVLQNARILIQEEAKRIPSLVNHLYQRGIHVYWIEKTKQSLEDFFLDTTQGKERK
ncbi:ABC transporter ATP-binding protein [Paenibacillus montanisoli]|uniref:ABC transporter ATP-binding protein n=1 Tax=Paenibacillus montanisoli TaxID=2081970 RepID=A0A328TYQ9_9BACL|nr:ABC transporter ATP-binding protein [Paenibacillus montanisoli]RAP73785.1 ABC transporter ATP-binding protein [Paenibacillus montanisoli]